MIIDWIPSEDQGTEPRRQRLPVARKLRTFACPTHIRDLRLAVLVQDRHTAVAVGHDGPLGLLMPVEFANAARAQAHVNARSSWSLLCSSQCFISGAKGSPRVGKSDHS